MPEDKRPLKVFLCHAHSDKDTVKALYTRLTNDGVDAWLDKEKLLPGQDWELEIRKAVREADVVVVCLSKQFNQAGFRQKEVRLALDTAMEQPEGEIFIVPARLEVCDTLESLRKWHWVDLFEDDGYDMLTRALRARADSIGVTLQIKRGWFPKITSPITKSQKTVDEPKKQDAELVNDIPDEPPPDNFPDGWDDEWKKGFASASNAENKLKKQEEFLVETPEPKGSQPKKTKSLRKPNTAIVVAIIGAVATIIAGLLSSPLLEKWFSPAPVVTEIATATFTLTSQPFVPSQTFEPTQVSETPTITFTPTESFTPTSTPLPTEITDAKGVSMILVPAGEFTMGSDDYDSWESPAHMVYIDAFYIDKYEVTNALYKMCVEVGACIQPNDIVRYTNPKYNNHPVVYVTWKMSSAYCEWRGARLPTEAEWEKAARGTSNSTYPWGEAIDCSYANYYGANGNCVGDTTEVGKYENGKSFYGVYDMAGNVYEWVSSLSKSYPYDIDDGREDQDSPLKRIVRGGSWNNIKESVRSSKRTEAIPLNFNYYYGFRCAKDAP